MPAGAGAIFQDLIKRGFQVDADGDQLTIRHSSAKLSDADRAAIRQNKPGLLKLAGSPKLERARPIREAIRYGASYLPAAGNIAGSMAGGALGAVGGLGGAMAVGG